MRGEEGDPVDLLRLIERRDQAVNKIDKSFLKALDALKINYMKKSDLNSANRVESVISKIQNDIGQRDTELGAFPDSILGMKWEWRSETDTRSYWAFFNPNGTFTANFTDDKKIRWNVVGPRQIRITFPTTQAIVTLTWDEKSSKYTGIDTNQKTGLKLKMSGTRITE